MTHDPSDHNKIKAQLESDLGKLGNAFRVACASISRMPGISAIS